MTWHYQCIRHSDADGDWFEVHELYDNKSLTQQGVSPSGCSPEDLIKILENMIKDIKAYGVKDYIDDPR